MILYFVKWHQTQKTSFAWTTEEAVCIGILHLCNKDGKLLLFMICRSVYDNFILNTFTHVIITKCNPFPNYISMYDRYIT